MNGEKRTAGTESTANTTSDTSMTARANSRGVAIRWPSCTVKKFSPSYRSETLMNRLRRRCPPAHQDASPATKIRMGHSPVESVSMQLF